MPEQDFREIFKAAKCGDENAREALCEQALSMALQAARRSLNRTDRQFLDSVDIRQSVVIRFIDRLPDLTFEGEPQLAGWLGKVASNLVREKRRNAQRQKRDQRRNVALPTAGLPDPLAQSVSRVVNRIFLSEVLGLLTDEEAALLRLHKVEGRTFEEIARQLNLKNAEAARRKCARTFVKLAGKLPPEMMGI